MTPVDFPEKNIVIAKDQPEYIPLPAYYNPQTGAVCCCWELSEDELQQVIHTRKIWHIILTNNKPLQPQLLFVHRPQFEPQPETVNEEPPAPV